MCVWCSFSVSVLVGDCPAVELNGGQEMTGDGNEPSGPICFPKEESEQR